MTPHLRFHPLHERLIAGSCIVSAILCVLSLVTACADTHRLPKFRPVPEDFYPAASRRLGEEGRVVVEFHLDEHRRPVQIQIRESSENSRLEDSARKVVRSLQFDPSDHSKPDPRRTYSVRIAYCFDSLENCKKRFFPLDDFNDTK